MAAGHRESLIGGEDAGPNFGSGFDFIAKAGIKISQTAHGTDRGDAASEFVLGKASNHSVSNGSGE